MAQCNSPYHKMNEKTKCMDTLPCGKCVECIARRISGWSFRLRKEGERSSSSFFLTLTYDTKYVPITEKGYMTLDRQDPTKWLKRLRKHIFKQGKQTKIKYYLCGEYGSERDRPHYHVIIFNVELEDLIGKTNAIMALNNKELMLNGKFNFNCPTWGLGSITIGDVSNASIGYVLKYMVKDPKKPIPRHANDDRIPIFSNMSKGLGDNYLNEQNIKWHKNDINNRYYIPIEDGKKIAMPRYYKQKMFTDWQRKKIAAHLKGVNDTEQAKKTLKDIQKEHIIAVEKQRRKTHLKRPKTEL